MSAFEEKLRKLVKGVVAEEWEDCNLDSEEEAIGEEIARFVKWLYQSYLDAEKVASYTPASCADWKAKTGETFE